MNPIRPIGIRQFLANQIWPGLPKILQFANLKYRSETEQLDGLNAQNILIERPKACKFRVLFMKLHFVIAHLLMSDPFDRKELYIANIWLSWTKFASSEGI